MPDPVAKKHKNPDISGARVLTFAAACGMTVANLYYIQPLTKVIGHEFGIGEAGSGLAVTVTQTGYIAGLLFLVPLSDFIENRRLITTVFLIAAAALLAISWAPSFPVFLAISAMIGISSVAAQLLVPLAAHLATPESRGQVVGKVMSGLLTGILLARAFAGFISGALGWRAVYRISAGLLLVMVPVLLRMLPERRPDAPSSYGKLLKSLAEIFAREPQLRRRSTYQLLLFGTFTAFWTSVTFLLSNPQHHLSQTSIGWFSLAGAAGAMVAPVAGWLGDHGHARSATGSAMLLAVGAFSLTLLESHMAALVAGCILLDMGVNTVHVLNQHIIYTLNPAERGRLNTIYMVMFFIGGSISSALSSLMYARFGWPGVVAVGGGMATLAFLFWLTESSTASKAAGTHALNERQ